MDLPTNGFTKKGFVNYWLAKNGFAYKCIYQQMYLPTNVFTNKCIYPKMYLPTNVITNKWIWQLMDLATNGFFDYLNN